MELRNLMTFLKIVEVQNFTKAAEQLGYSQPTVTIQIQQLEEELQTKLFERIGKQISVTQKGWEVFRYAKEIQNLVEEMTYSTKKESQLSGSLCIGVIESLLISELPELLAHFHKQYPSVEVIIKEGHTETLLEQMAHNTVDFIFLIEDPIYHRDWVKFYEKEEEISFFAPAQHPLAQKESLSIEEVLQQPFLLTEKKISYRKKLDQYIEQHAPFFTPLLEVGSTKIIVELMKKDCGISFLPNLAVREELQNNTFVKLPVSGWHVTMWKQVIYHKNKYLSPQMKAFLHLLQQAEQSH